MPTRKKRRAEETGLSKAIQDTLTAKGAKVIRIQTGIIPADYGGKKRYIHCAPAGTPDLLVIRCATSVHPYARYFHLEVKKKAKSDPNKKQLEWAAWAKESGVNTFVVRSISEAVDAVFGNGRISSISRSDPSDSAPRVGMYGRTKESA